MYRRSADSDAWAGPLKMDAERRMVVVQLFLVASLSCSSFASCSITFPVVGFCSSTLQQGLFHQAERGFHDVQRIGGFDKTCRVPKMVFDQQFSTRRNLLYKALTVFAGVQSLAGAKYAKAIEESKGIESNYLWDLYNNELKNVKYIDLTHAFSPTQPVWPGFAKSAFKPAIAGRTIDGFIKAGEEFDYDKHGFVATAYDLTTDQYGTQLDPPAHWNPLGATISDIPATFTLRPLVVINIADKVKRDEGYHMQVSDILEWENRHGRVPEGSVVMVRSDWYKKWEDAKRFERAPFPGVSLAALKLLHLERRILFHGHEPLDTDGTPNLEGEFWLMHNNFAQVAPAAPRPPRAPRAPRR
jgi:kynurenine formamidase